MNEYDYQVWLSKQTPTKKGYRSAKRGVKNAIGMHSSSWLKGYTPPAKRKKRKK